LEKVLIIKKENMSEVKFYFNDPIGLDKFVETFKLSFGKAIDIEWIRWRFLENPDAEKAYIAYIERDDKIVSCCTGTPHKIYIDGSDALKFVQSGFGLISKNY
jgi:hypothetical protein